MQDEGDTYKWLHAAYDDCAVWMSDLAGDPLFDRYRSSPVRHF